MVETLEYLCTEVLMGWQTGRAPATWFWSMAPDQTGRFERNCILLSGCRPGSFAHPQHDLAAGALPGSLKQLVGKPRIREG